MKDERRKVDNNPLHFPFDLSSFIFRLQNAAFADKPIRMNYDIHTGGILGLPGKILMFFASLLAASLPVTGVYIWIGRKKKKKVYRPVAARMEAIPA